MDLLSSFSLMVQSHSLVVQLTFNLCGRGFESHLDHMKQWSAGEKVIRNNNTDAGEVISQNGKQVTVKLDSGGTKVLGANDLKRRR